MLSSFFQKIIHRKDSHAKDGKPHLVGQIIKTNLNSILWMFAGQFVCDKRDNIDKEM